MLPAAPPAVDLSRADQPGAPIRLADVRIDEDGGLKSAHPRKHWRAPVGRTGDPQIEVGLQEPLDARWVRRQFERNKLIGAPTTADRVVALTLLINQAYAQNGYVNTGLLFVQQDWPPQGAVLNLRLVTGRIVPSRAGAAAVDVGWARRHARGLRKRYVLARMPAGAQVPFNAIALERDFRLLADDPAIRTINAQLTPGADAGQASLSLKVDPAPRLDVYASYSNSRSPTIGGERGAVGGSVRNLVFSGDVLSAEGGLTDGLEDGTVSYSTPFLTPRTFFDVRASYDSAAVVEPALRSLGIRVQDTDIEGGVSQILFQQPLTPRADGGGWEPAQTLTVGLRAAEKYSTSYLLGSPFSFAPGAVDGRSYFTVLRATANWVERSENYVLSLSGTASFGLRGSGSDVPGVEKPDPNFHVLAGQFNFARRLTSGGLELHARLSGQWADGLLYSPEQLAAGGQTTVRGYRENLLLADTGAIGSLELSCPVAFGAPFCAARGGDWKTVRAGVFVDAAHVGTHFDPQPTPANIASVGVSVAWTPIDALFVRLTYGGALVKAVQVGPSDLQDEGFEFEVTVHPLTLLRHRSASN